MRARCAERARPPTSAARALLVRASALAAVAASAVRAAAASIARAAAAARAASPPPSPLPLHPTRRATASPSPSPPGRPPSQLVLLDGVRTTLRPMGARAPPRAAPRTTRAAYPSSQDEPLAPIRCATPPDRPGGGGRGKGGGGAGSGVRGVVASTIPLGWSVGRHAHSERIPSDQNLGETGGDCRRVAAHRVEISGHFMHWRGLACGPAGSAGARVCRARTDFCPLLRGGGAGRHSARAARGARRASPFPLQALPPAARRCGRKEGAMQVCVRVRARASARARGRRWGRRA